MIQERLVFFVPDKKTTEYIGKEWSMKRTETKLDLFWIKTLKKVHYRVDGKSEKKSENFTSYLLMFFAVVTFCGELWILKNVSFVLFLLNIVSLLKRIIECVIENNKLKREYCRVGTYDETRKSSYELLLFILVPSMVLLVSVGALLLFCLYRNSNSEDLQSFFYLIVLANMIVNLASNIFNAIVALYRAKASYGEII